MFLFKNPCERHAKNMRALLRAGDYGQRVATYTDCTCLAARVDLHAVEAAERRAFVKRERRAAAAAKREKEGPGPGERIMGLVSDLNRPLVVRDFDSEINNLVKAAQAPPPPPPQREERPYVSAVYT